MGDALLAAPADRALAGQPRHDAGEVRRRLAAQMPTQQMIAQAHRVIDTGGSRAETRIQALCRLGRAGAAAAAADHPLRGAGRCGLDGDGAELGRARRWPDHPGSDVDRSRNGASSAATAAARARTLAQIGNVVVGFQFVEPYATYTGAMDHVGTLGSYVIAPLRGRGLGAAMSRATFAAAREPDSASS